MEDTCDVGKVYLPGCIWIWGLSFFVGYGIQQGRSRKTLWSSTDQFQWPRKFALAPRPTWHYGPKLCFKRRKMWFGWWKKIFSMRKEFVTMHAYMDLIAHNFGISLLCLIPSRKPVWPAAFLPALQLSVKE